jgi:hypothetical protein
MTEKIDTGTLKDIEIGAGVAVVTTVDVEQVRCTQTTGDIHPNQIPKGMHHGNNRKICILIDEAMTEALTVAVGQIF